VTLALELTGVRKVFGRVVAVDQIDLAVPRGQLVGLIGHNGAGKSTTLAMIMGLLRPTSGTVRLCGVDVQADPVAARAQIGAVPETPAVFEYLSAREHLELVSDLRGLPDGAAAVASALALTGLGDDADRLIREYSQGMRRKTALAMALLGAPPVVVLDEALNGLDPPSAARVKGALRDYVDQGGTVLFSTHIVETIEAVADRVVMLAAGRVVEDVLTRDLAPGGLEALFLERVAATTPHPR
jgi:ABC-2 type transport system ATP-binding protein